MMMIIMTMMVMIMMMFDDDDDDDDEMMMMMLAHGWRPPCGGERAQRDTAPKLIVIDFAEIQNWGRC